MVDGLPGDPHDPGARASDLEESGVDGAADGGKGDPGEAGDLVQGHEDGRRLFHGEGSYASWPFTKGQPHSPSSGALQKKTKKAAQVGTTVPARPFGVGAENYFRELLRASTSSFRTPDQYVHGT